MTTYSVEQQIDRWEHQRDIKNMMGKYVNDLLLARDTQLFSKYWAQKAPDVCLGLNNGWYLGAEDIQAYYASTAAYIGLVNKALRAKFPEQLGAMPEEASYGVGVFRVNPISSAIVEVADDEKTAKGLWICLGAKAETKSCGPAASWLFGYFAVDFTWEDGAWKIWHMQYLLDVDSACGQDWSKPAQPYEDRPEFSALKGVRFAPPTQSKVLREYYTPERALLPTPRIPEPYESFAKTFSYGAEEEVPV